MHGPQITDCKIGMYIRAGIFWWRIKFFIATNGKMIYYNTNMTGTGGIVPSSGYLYRYVIIPGGVAGGRIVSGPAAGHTADELRAMSYQQIAQMFNIPSNGSNEQ